MVDFTVGIESRARAFPPRSVWRIDKNRNIFIEIASERFEELHAVRFAKGYAIRIVADRFQTLDKSTRIPP